MRVNEINYDLTQLQPTIDVILTYFDVLFGIEYVILGNE